MCAAALVGRLFLKKQKTAACRAFRPASGDLHDALLGTDFMSAVQTIPRTPGDVKSPRPPPGAFPIVILPRWAICQ